VGLDEVPYLTNDTVLDLETRPNSMVIIGGGYIACELGHFFSAVGTDVTIMRRNERLVHCPPLKSGLFQRPQPELLAWTTH